MFFESPPLYLHELLDQIHNGDIQLPDFQRPWKWDDEHIVSLLATVTLGYPLGVVMTLRTGGTGTRFKPRPLAGVELPPGTAPEQLIMDGQQRLTSLFQALRSGKPAETTDSRGREITRWYYIDIAKALDDRTDREDTIISVPADRKVMERRSVVLDLSTRNAECEAGLFPLHLTFKSESVNEWQQAYVTPNPSRWDIWGQFHRRILSNVQSYQLPVIRLARETPKEAICTVFEKVNTGGVPLTTFELLTATYASDDFNLPEHWSASLEQIASHPVFEKFEDTDFLQAVTLIYTYFTRRSAVSCKRADMLDLPLGEYQQWAPQIVSALDWCADFLRRQGVFQWWDLPYRSQIVALAAIRAVLGPEADSSTADALITRWYWCGVLGEQYGGSPDSRLPRDLEQVAAWVRGGPEPASVTEANFPSARLDTMSTRNSAAYKGVLALLMREGATDWIYTKEPINAIVYSELQQVDVALVFPKGWCVKNAVRKDQRDSIVNKTPLTNRTWRIMGNQPPSMYLRQIEAESGLPDNWQDDIIGTHRIEPRYLRADDFQSFYRARSAALKELIDEAMGRQAAADEDEP